jgi:hypothetical protein
MWNSNKNIEIMLHNKTEGGGVLPINGSCGQLLV